MSLLNIYGTTTFWMKIFILLCVMLVMLIISAIFMILFNVGFSGLIPQPDIIVGNMFIQSVFLFIFTSIITAGLFSKEPFRYLKIDKAPSLIALTGVVVCMVALIPFMNLVITWNESLKLPESFSWLEIWMREREVAAQQLTEQLMTFHSLGSLVVLIITVGVLTGIGEETLFRGVLQRLLWESTKNKHIAVWLGAIIFSAVHFQFFGFVPRMLLGAFFGYLLVWSGNIWLPITAHFFNNSLTIVIRYLENNGYKMSELETIGTPEGNNMIIALYSLLLFAACTCGLYWFIKRGCMVRL